MSLRALRRTVLLGVVLFGGAVQAHENLPASLLIDEGAPQEFELRWRVPATQGVAPALSPRLPADCTPLTAPHESAVAGARLTRWRMRCTGGLRGGERIAIEGLSTTMIDVIVRVAHADGHHVSLVARPRSPEVTLPLAAPRGLALPGYFGLGVEHILSGVDHLLFVLCLILLVRGRLALLKTITAFTLAHSVTLALSALGIVQVPQAPVEAAIALSILFLACELARQRAADGLAGRRPWLVAFAFGLLHGFGFADALAEVGLPHGDVPLALALFNAGVEVGQVLFVVMVLGLMALLRLMQSLRLAGSAFGSGRMRLGALPVHAIGAVSAFWWLQRMAIVIGAQGA